MRLTIALARHRNRQDYFDVKGIRFWYSPQTTWMTVIFWSGIAVLNIVWFCMGLGGWSSLFFVIFPIFMLVRKAIPRLIYKNPVFILEGERLFYTPNNTWYDFKDVIITEDNYREYNHYRSLCILDENLNLLIRENFWYIEFDEDLRKMLAKYYNWEVMEFRHRWHRWQGWRKGWVKGKKGK